MRFLLTALILIAGIFYVLIGIGFIVDPLLSAASFGLEASSTNGLSTLRADMTAFFLLGGATMIWGAWKRNGDVLLVPAALFGVAFVGRFVSLFADGTYDQFFMPMAVELLTVIVAVAGTRILPHHHIEDFEEIG